jgi:hypothetical protein
MKKNFIKTFALVLVIAMTPFSAFAANDDYIPINIDGYYDDWEDKPATEVYPGHNPPESKINYVSLFRDEDYVYVHVLFAYKNNQDITNMTINLYTNMGNESYFLEPDFFWNTDMQTEPDMTLDQSTELSPPAQAPAPDEGSETESLNETAPAEPGVTTESGDSAEQSILAGHEVPSYVLVADKDKTDPAADTSNPAKVTKDEKTNNGQGNGSGNTDGSAAGPDTGTESDVVTNPAEDTDLSNVVDMFDLGNLMDLDNVLDQFAGDEAADSGVPADSADMNSNLNLKKPRWNGTWGFTVWDGLFPVGSGYYTRTEGEPDELELYIPLSSIAHHYDGITEISMRIKKLGPQYIMCTGVSTGAVIGVAAGVGIALLSVGAYTYRRKQPFLLSKGK